MKSHMITCCCVLVNRWMDGSFQDLDGESMEGKVDEFFRECFKMQKFFQQKQNKAEQEMEKMAGTTKRRDSVDSPRKQESPSVLLCSTVLEQIKEFKVVYPEKFKRNSEKKVLFC